MILSWKGREDVDWSGRIFSIGFSMFESVLLPVVPIHHSHLVENELCLRIRSSPYIPMADAL